MVYRRSEGVTVSVVDGRAFLLDRDAREMITLNPTGTMVWEALDGTNDVDAIARRIADQFDVDAAPARRDVEAFLSELAGLALVEKVGDH